jgi:hypothetical protein
MAAPNTAYSQWRAMQVAMHDFSKVTRVPRQISAPNSASGHMRKR